MCKQWVNQILSCANQNQPCVNFFAPYANPYISAIPNCFAKSSRDTSYFNVLIQCRTFLVQSGEVTFGGQKKFSQFITIFTGLPPRWFELFFISEICAIMSIAEAQHWRRGSPSCSDGHWTLFESAAEHCCVLQSYSWTETKTTESCVQRPMNWRMRASA
jgi:hypothetical protein